MNNYIGLMSGTSMDGIDVALISIDKTQLHCLNTLTYPIPNDIKQKLLALNLPGQNEINLLGQLDREMGILFAQAVQALLAQPDCPSRDAIQAIGSHGQTIRHMPNEPYCFSIQIGDPNIIASHTGITTVADFRRKDLALGGQGAPLVPAFHEFLFGHFDYPLVVLNIGGIANITYINPLTKTVLGFDTGPGNMLLDAWIYQHLGKNYDKDGAWAQTGQANEGLLDSLLNDPYFTLPCPKSTGREYFNLSWLTNKNNIVSKLAPADVQATLSVLTARSIAAAIANTAPDVKEVIVCGGGARNSYLMQLLANEIPCELSTTEKYHIDPDYVEACAFAWCAHNTVDKLPSNLIKVTGATRPAVLGGIYYP